ncbi:MAG: hypothetical protein SNJ60_04995, partial [Pseudanabaenaceae cyanobacterium]
MDNALVICPFVWEPPDCFVLLGSSFNEIFKGCPPSLAGIASSLSAEAQSAFWAAVPTAVSSSAVWQWQGKRWQGEMEIRLGLQAEWAGTAWYGAF